MLTPHPLSKVLLCPPAELAEATCQWAIPPSPQLQILSPAGSAMTTFSTSHYYLPSVATNAATAPTGRVGECPAQWSALGEQA